MFDVLVYLFRNYYTPQACPTADVLAKRLVAAGFEHSIANMYLMPLAMLLQHGGLTGYTPITWIGMLGNWLPVILGNILGGSVLVAGIYHVIYKRQPAT